MRAVFLLCLTLLACTKPPSNRPVPFVTWHVPAVQLSNEAAARHSPGEPLVSLGALVVIDSASLRPVVARRGGSGVASVRVNDSTFSEADLVLPAIVTTYQGGRYHAETIRALTNDSAVMTTTAAAIVRSSPGSRIVLDFQGATSDDVPGLVEMVRAVGLAGRRVGRDPLAVIVPAGDTIAYPTSIIARVADIIVIRLHGEHRPGTAPGPLATPEFIARSIGLRAREIGASRLGVELPLFGYRWNRDGTASLITYSDAQALVHGEAGTFTRDPPSQFLTATGRDGWTIWLPDAQTVRSMISAVQRRGIRYVALAGVEGADPAALATVDTTIRR
jgi:hypothetical protein